MSLKLAALLVEHPSKVIRPAGAASKNYDARPGRRVLLAMVLQAIVGSGLLSA